MRVRGLLKALAGVAALASVTGVAADQGIPVATSGGLYALSTTAGLTLMSGGRVVSRAAAGQQYQSGSFGFTQDGRFTYLAAADEKDADTGAILSIDVKTHQGSELRCDCKKVTAAGGSTVAWFDSDGALMEADLSARPVRPHRKQVALPAVPGVDQYPYAVLAGDDGILVVGSQAVAPITPQLLIIGPAGNVGRLRTPPPAFAGRPTAARTGGGGREPAVAIVVPATTAGCAHPGVDLINPLTGHLTTTDARPAGASDDLAESIDDLWWGADGSLYAAVALAPCGSNQSPLHRIWRLDDRAWHAIGPDLVTDARQITSSTTVTTLSTDASKLYLSSAFSPIPADGQVLGLATPDTPADTGPATLRLGSGRCSRQAFGRHPPRFFTSASVTGYACRDGYAYARYEQGSGAARVSRGELLAAIGPAWQVIATGTAWDGRILPQDLSYAGLDVTTFLDRFPEAAETIPVFDPDVSGLVGTWSKELNGTGTGRLVVTNDRHATFTYRVAPQPEYHVTLLFVRTTRDSAIALARTSDDPRVVPGARFKIDFGPRSLQMFKPYGYGDAYDRVG